jgi:hypothetical protein
MDGSRPSVYAMAASAVHAAKGMGAVGAWTALGRAVCRVLRRLRRPLVPVLLSYVTGVVGGGKGSGAVGGGEELSGVSSAGIRVGLVVGCGGAAGCCGSNCTFRGAVPVVGTLRGGSQGDGTLRSAGGILAGAGCGLVASPVSTVARVVSVL